MIVRCNQNPETFRLTAVNDADPSNPEVLSVRFWWESAHKEWCIALVNEQGTEVEYHYARNKQDRDEQVAMLEMIHGIN